MLREAGNRPGQNVSPTNSFGRFVSPGGVSRATGRGASRLPVVLYPRENGPHEPPSLIRLEDGLRVGVPWQDEGFVAASWGPLGHAAALLGPGPALAGGA